MDCNAGCDGAAIAVCSGWAVRAAVVGLLGLCVLMVAGCEEPLKHGLDESEANAMVASLSEHGIEAHKVRDPADDDRWAVQVPHEDRIEAWSVLEARGFPRPEEGGFDDFYPGGGLIPTAKEERVVLQYATARELQTSLLNVEGIVDANVHLVLPDEPRVQITDDENAKPRASVLIQWQQRGGEPPLSTDQIQKLVSGAVEDLDEQRVHVVMTPVAPVQPAADAEDRQLARVGPVAVAPESEGLLKATVLLMGGIIVALSSGLVFVLWRGRRDHGDEGGSP